VTTYLGAGNNIYASEQNLYIAVSGYRGFNTGRRMKTIPLYGADKTLLYKFSLTKGAMTYLCKGEVPGTILNQYSMDENGNNLRIATTSYSNSDHVMQNNVYVTDELLNVTGKLENLAPGERIYSVRFMGERAYVVTFRNVDPLFVIELKGSSNPKVLGALKIPGYSNYLHPYDDKHIIGFGKDTVDGKGGTAYYMGLKMAMFDVSDVEKPVEMFTEKIGDRGTDSEVLNNPKALLFSKEKNLLALPVTLMEIKDGGKTKSEFPEYGRFVFQGAYVYNIDLLNGFKLKGRITHLGRDDIEKAGDYWYQSPLNIDRILYIDDMLYTLSQRFIKANDIKDLTEKKTLQIP
ncbi:MAG TPA: beta-propeller domain-containing protein, partial [Clostridia bacterium]